MVLTTNLMDASRVRSAVPDAAVARSLADDALAPRNQRAKKTGPPIRAIRVRDTVSALRRSFSHWSKAR